MDGFGLEAEARMTTWHVMIPSENETDSAHNHDVSEGESTHTGLFLNVHTKSLKKFCF